MQKSLIKRLSAEALGTAILVIIACGVAVVTQANVVATALAFGLVIVAMAYTIGPVSGCHINPAVSLAMAINKRITWVECGLYAVAQTVGAIIGAGGLFAVSKLLGRDKILVAAPDTYLYSTFGSNGYSGLTDTKWKAIVAALLIEILLTFIFVLTIMAVTSKKSTSGKKAGLIIGLTLTLVHLFGISFTGTSVNPARSIGPAIFAALNHSSDPIKDVWLFIVAPLVGAALAAIVAKFLLKTEEEAA